MKNSIPLNTEIEVRNGKIKSFRDYGLNQILLARHIYEAHELAAKSLGFSCGAELDEYLKSEYV